MLKMNSSVGSMDVLASEMFTVLEVEDRENLGLSGSAGIIFEWVLKTLRCRGYEIRLTINEEEFTVNARNEKGEPFGPIKSLYENLSDVVIPGYLVEDEHDLDLIDFGGPFFVESSKMHSGGPIRREQGFFEILHVLHLSVWLVYFSYIVTYPFISALCYRWSRNHFSTFYFQRLFSIWSQCLGQGERNNGPHCHGKLSGWFINAPSIISTIIMSWIIQSVLLAKITTPLPPIGIDSIADILDDNRDKVYLMKNSPEHRQLLLSGGDVGSRVLKKAMDCGGLYEDIYNIVTAIEEVRDGKATLLYGYDTFLTIMNLIPWVEDLPVNYIYASKDTVTNFLFAFPSSKRTPRNVKETYYRTLNWAYESGVPLRVQTETHSITKNFLVKMRMEINAATDTLEASHFRFPFALYFAGLFISFVVHFYQTRLRGLLGSNPAS